MTRLYRRAVIDENVCIGCTKCIQACPFDAIIGASGQMHTVMIESCTGCGLCISPCPVDCIDLKPLEKPLFDRALIKKRKKDKALREKSRELFAPLPQNKEDQKTIKDLLSRLKLNLDFSAGNKK